MRHYRNTIDAPGEKQTGLDVQLGGLWGGRLALRGLVNDLLDFETGGPVYGLRAEVSPGAAWRLGGTLVMDTNQLCSLPDSVTAGMAGNAYGVVGLDASYLFWSGAAGDARLYAGFSRSVSADSAGTGFSGPGARLSLGGLTAQAEFRWTDGHVTPGHFDALYERNRSTLHPATGLVTTAEDRVPGSSLWGVFGDLTLSLGPLLEAQAACQSLNGDGGRHWLLEARAKLRPGVLDLLPRLGAAEAYFQNRKWMEAQGGLFEPTPEMRFGYVLELMPGSGVRIVWDTEFTYEPDDDGGYTRHRRLNLQSVLDL